MAMRTLDLVKSVRHTFKTSRLRVALTLLGVMIGSGSMVLLAGLLVAGEEALVRLAQHANESDMIEVQKRPPPRQDAGRTTRPLSSWDAEALAENPLLAGAGGAGGAQVNANARQQLTARHGGAEKLTTLFAAETDSLALYRLTVEQGRFFTADDFRERRRVAVVGQEMWTELLDKKDLSARGGEGLRIVLDGTVLEVVGVLAHKPTMGKGGGTWMWNRRVMVPATTYHATFAGPAARGRQVQSIYVRLKDNAGLVGKMRQLTDVVERTILRRHHGVKNFETESDARGADQEELILRIIEVLLFGTGVIALFVGGINIMNIMLVTVTERTPEIGLRRALGATPAEIARQFLLEAAALAGAGGLLGVVGGIGATFLVAELLTAVLAPWRFVVEPWAVALAFGMATGTGALFGLFPALRAAKLDPVVALRSD